MRISNDLITHIKENLKRSIRLNPDEMALLNQDLIALELKEQNFKKIDCDKTNQDTDKEPVEYVAIDGGNSSVVETNFFILDFVKVAIINFVEKKTKDIKILSGFISATYIKDTKTKNPVIQCKITDYKGELKKYAPEILEFESAKLSPNELKDTINLIRKEIEYQLLNSICSEKQNSVILRDGSLINLTNQTFSNEELIKNIYNSSRANNNQVFGVSKDSLIYTNHGNHLTSLLYFIAKQNKETNNDSWLIQVGETKNEPKIGIFIAQLNKKAKVCFRIDSFREDSIKSFSLLTKISKDPSFLGYPYPLIIADKFARVSNEEARLIKQVIEKSIKNSDLSKLENFFNSHKFLDSIR